MDEGYGKGRRKGTIEGMTEVCKLLATLAGGGGKGIGKGAEGGGKGRREGKGEFMLATFAVDDEFSAVFDWVLRSINEMASKLHASGYAAGQDDPNRAGDAWRESRHEAFRNGLKEGKRQGWDEASPTLRDFLFLCGSLVLPWPFLGSEGYRNDREPYKAPSGLDISPCGTIMWTHFKPNSTNSSNKKLWAWSRSNNLWTKGARGSYSENTRWRP